MIGSVSGGGWVLGAAWAAARAAEADRLNLLFLLFLDRVLERALDRVLVSLLTIDEGRAELGCVGALLALGIRVISLAAVVRRRSSRWRPRLQGQSEPCGRISKPFGGIRRSRSESVRCLAAGRL